MINPNLSAYVDKKQGQLFLLDEDLNLFSFNNDVGGQILHQTATALLFKYRFKVPYLSVNTWALG